MDKRLEKALEFSNYMLTLNNQKRILLEKYQEELIHFYNGTQFTITRELIAFISAIVSNKQDKVVITNDNNNPCVVENLEDFYFAICEKIDVPASIGQKFNRNLENKRVLLILDNVGKLNGAGFTRDMRDHLRGLAEGENACLKLVLAANESLQILFNDSYETSPLADSCLPIDIPVWDKTIIREFITKRLQPTTIDFTEADIQKLIQESGGYPQKLTQLCYNLYKKYSESSI